MEKVIGIYKITSPKSLIYIGQSIDCHTRKRWYKNLNCKQQHRLYNSIMKYGWDQHKFEIINQCNREQLNDLEVYYIELYQSFNSKFGMNLRPGGDGGREWSQESKQKLSSTLKNKWDSGSFKRKPRTVFQKGIEPWNKGKKGVQKGLIGGQSTSSKELVDTKTGEIFPSMMDAAKSNGINRSTLSDYLRGYRTNKTNLIYLSDAQNM